MNVSGIQSVFLQRTSTDTRFIVLQSARGSVSGFVKCPSTASGDILSDR